MKSARVKRILRRTPSPAMVIACLALTIALSGAGYAAIVLPANSVGTAQLKKFAVTAGKIKPGNVTRGKITANAVNGAKVADGTLGSADIADGTLGSADIADGALTAGHLAPTALDGFFAAVSVADGCNADQGVLTTCISTSVNTARAGKLLLNATGQWYTFALDDLLGANEAGDDVTLVRGVCNLAVDGAAIGLAQNMGERPSSGLGDHPYQQGGTLALTALSGNLAAGVHTVEVACLEEDGDLDWYPVNLTAALVDDATPPVTSRVRPAPATQGVPDQSKG